MRWPTSRNQRSAAVTAIEVVLTTGLTSVLILIFLPLGLLACRRMWQMFETLINWPYF
jgi:hypothetical protein